MQLKISRHQYGYIVYFEELYMADIDAEDGICRIYRMVSPQVTELLDVIEEKVEATELLSKAIPIIYADYERVIGSLFD